MLGNLKESFSVCSFQGGGTWKSRQCTEGGQAGERMMIDGVNSWRSSEAAGRIQCSGQRRATPKIQGQRKPTTGPGMPGNGSEQDPGSEESKDLTRDQGVLKRKDLA
ncbi:hypothetical protein ATANTOWER_007502 [Ataeniobius toweri]|uniref:Uncharacterized protein n=1 Tax=Ataeniobius toweri TaxID=208326 RepID=A0ABU7APK7_9TELE|nr:hypothetical protein [Ataeniobius toweri]